MASTVVSKMHLTAMDISACGKYLGVGTAKGEVLVINNSNLNAIMKVESHQLAVTSLCFNRRRKIAEKETVKGTATDNLAVISCGIDKLVVFTPVKENIAMSMC